ncbi:hypothetical protein N0V85_009207 [Neurospora sp. IMI 360204]|nr:hypothetical protein N0V85_009207 [Neurospora sp. IMI 360204]
MDFLAKAGLAIDKLLSTGNPVFSDVKRLATELGYESEVWKFRKNNKSANKNRQYQDERDRRASMTKKRTPLLISIMEYPKWRINRSAWSEFLDIRKEVGIGMDMNTELREAVGKFVKRIDDNRSTTIVENQPKAEGKGEPMETARETDEEMDEDDDSS